MEGLYEWVTIPIVSYQIVDSDEVWHHPDNSRDFNEAERLLESLKRENPGKEYTMYAELY
jgi:hypothetical protein